MFNWYKKFRNRWRTHVNGVYMGSTRRFGELAIEIEQQIKSIPRNDKVILREMDLLTTLMQTMGDGNIIRILISEYKLIKEKENV